MTYDEFLARTARDCRNCLECSSRPCDACCAGGICDRECHCDDIDESFYDENDDDVTARSATQEANRD